MQRSEIRDTFATHQTPRIAFHFIRATNKITASMTGFGLSCCSLVINGFESDDWNDWNDWNCWNQII